VPLQAPFAQSQPFGTNPYWVLPAGGLKPALLLRSCFRYFSLSLQSAWHISIALLVLYRSDRVYRCPLRDTPKTQATVPSSPTQEEAARDSSVKGYPLPGSRKSLTGLSRLLPCLTREVSEPMASQLSGAIEENPTTLPSPVHPRSPAWSSARKMSAAQAKGPPAEAGLPTHWTGYRDRQGDNAFRLLHFTRRY